MVPIHTCSTYTHTHKIPISKSKRKLQEELSNVVSSLLAQAQHPLTSQLQLEIIYVEKVDSWNKSKSYLGLRSPTSFKPKSLYLEDSFVLI